MLHQERLTGCESHHLCPEILKALDGILFIAEHKKKDEESTKVNIPIVYFLSFFNSFFKYQLSNNNLWTKFI